MRLSFKNERILAIVAHPDDAELLCAGTLARAKAEGAAIAVGVLCAGDKGQPDPPIHNLAEVRSGEVKAAAGLLGAELFEGGFGDGQLYDADEPREAVAEWLRQVGATLVLAHAENDYHPDHCAASAISAAASWFSASKGRRTASPPLVQAPTLWWMDTLDMIGFEPHFYVDVTGHVELKRRMLRCHKSQLKRGEDVDFSPLDVLMMRQCEARGAQSGVRAAEAFRQYPAWKRIGAW